MGVSGQFAASATLYGEAARLSRRRIDLLMQQATMPAIGGDLSSAEAVVEQARERRPDDPDMTARTARYEGLAPDLAPPHREAGPVVAIAAGLSGQAVPCG